ncbi:asparagine synthetase B family protein [Streptomyces sp. NPDC097107]|uniref:asparagine synthetase B family protein n=1 Tax=Streptomyces sp. NPDC097107 TaxID=3366089 RepID=UPI003818022B
MVFGSEPKALLARPSVPRRVGQDGLREVLEMVKTPEQGIFDGMYEVRPGQLVRVDRSGLTKRTYWALKAREHTDDLATTVDTVRGLLEDIVERQTVSDVPPCSLLSGGLDSSVITALASRALAGRGEGPVRSFSVDFEEHGAEFVVDPVRGSSDTPFVHDLVKHVGADHSEIIMNSGELADPALRAKVLQALDLPPAYWGDMWPSLYRLFQSVRERSTVALSGESADEVFGGYRWFFDNEAVRADTFPWLTSATGKYFDGKSLFDPGLIQKLDMPGFLKDSYASIVQRVKSPYPTTQDPAYELGLRAALHEVLADSSSPVLPLLDTAATKALLGRPVGDMSAQYDRSGLEMAPGLNS